MLLIKSNFSGFKNDINIKLFENMKLEFEAENQLDINKILKLNNKNKINSIKDEYSKLVDTLHLKDVSDWQKLIGSKNFKNRIKNIKETINYVKTLDENYLEILSKRYKLTSKVESCIFKEEIQPPGLYDHVSSKTGRIKITSGLNFLTMKKSDRTLLKSRQVNGRIYEIDIISLEPRILAKITRNEEIYDIYDHIAKNVLQNKYERKNIKLGLIATLYGAKNATVKKLSGLNSDCVNKIKNWFKLKEFSEQIITSKNPEDIKNFYGRYIYNSDSKINHYIQSTATDCAMLSFYNFINNSNKDIKIIALIHDAMILDVGESSFNYVENLEYLYDDIMKIKLPVKIERIS